MTQIKTYPSYDAYQSSRKPATAKTTQQSARDQIECRHTVHQIRQHYARFLAGKGMSARMEDIPQRHIKAAFAEPDIEKIVSKLADVWEVFKRK